MLESAEQEVMAYWVEISADMIVSNFHTTKCVRILYELLGNLWFRSRTRIVVECLCSPVTRRCIFCTSGLDTMVAVDHFRKSASVTFFDPVEGKFLFTMLMNQAGKYPSGLNGNCVPPALLPPFVLQESVQPSYCKALLNFCRRVGLLEVLSPRWLF